MLPRWVLCSSLPQLENCCIHVDLCPFGLMLRWFLFFFKWTFSSSLGIFNKDDGSQWFLKLKNHTRFKVRLCRHTVFHDLIHHFRSLSVFQLFFCKGSLPNIASLPCKDENSIVRSKLKEHWEGVLRIAVVRKLGSNSHLSTFLPKTQGGQITSSVQHS